MIAAAILALAAAAAMTVFGTGRAAVLRAEKRYEEQRLLSLATEFYLLGGPQGILPDLPVLPDGYQATCSISPVEEMEDEALTPSPGWALFQFEITLLRPDQTEAGSCLIRKILKEDDGN